jgi:hypothetical protein
MTVPDYSAFPAPAPEPASLAQIAALAEEAREAELAVADAEEGLKVARERLRDIIERRLPEAMDSVGMETFSARGLVVRVESDLQVKQPPVSQREAAYRWLEENEQGGLVKRSVEIAFGAGDEEAERAHALVDRLGVDFPNAVREGREVNTASLKAYLRRALAAGGSPPLELFGARAFRAARIDVK